MTTANSQNTDAVPQVLRGLKSLSSTRNGRPFRKDIWDLFGSLLLSLQIGTRKQMFKSFTYAFTGEEALKSLASLKFLRSLGPGSQNTNAMTIHMILDEGDAGKLMQHFIAGHMMKEARDDDPMPFRKNGIYQLTLKGLRILQEFIEDNAIESEADHLVAVLCTIPSPRPKLWRLERGREDDEIIVNPSIITNLFCRAVGKKPNYAFQSTSTAGVRLVPVDNRNTLLKPLFKKGLEPFGWKVTLVETTHCFEASKLLKFLCDNTTVTSMAEAAEMAAHFVRLGLITLVIDKAKKNDFVQIHRVNGYAPSGNPFISEEGLFRSSRSAIYAITDEGARQAGWPGFNSPPLLPPPITSSNSRGAPTLNPIHEPNLRSEDLVKEIVNGVNGKRLKRFLQDTNTRALFSEFLRKESCAYLLSFWIDVEDLKNELKEASNLVPEMPPVAGSSRIPLERMPSQQHYGPLNSRPFFIYNSYLTPSSEFQLANWIAPTLRTTLQTTLEEVLETLTNRALIAEMEPQETTTPDASQLEALVDIYDRIQAQVFCLLAVDFVPRFIKSPAFLDRRLGALAEDF